jgi:hypothetical protein
MGIGTGWPAGTRPPEEGLYHPLRMRMKWVGIAPTGQLSRKTIMSSKQPNNLVNRYKRGSLPIFTIDEIRSYGMRTCPRCQRILPPTEYGRDRTRRSGLSAYCRRCRANSRAKMKAQARPALATAA